MWWRTYSQKWALSAQIKLYLCRMWATVSDRIRAKRGQGRHETAVLENVCQRHGSTRHQPRDRDRSHHDERSRLNNQENCCRSATTQSRSPKWAIQGELETFALRSRISCGFGQQWIALHREFWPGSWVTTVLQRFDPCGTRFQFGNVTSGSVMAIQSIQASFQQATRSSARLIEPI